MPMTAKEKARTQRQILFSCAAIFLLIGLALAVGWCVRGMNQADYRGIGRAEVIRIRSDKRNSRLSMETRYHFTLHVTAGLSEFDCEEIRESRNDWHEGDVLPIVYNVKNPREFALNMSPDELAGWTNTMGIIAVIVLLVGIVCLFVGIRTKQPERIKSNFDLLRTYDRE